MSVVGHAIELEVSHLPARNALRPAPPDDLSELRTDPTRIGHAKNVVAPAGEYRKARAQTLDGLQCLLPSSAGSVVRPGRRPRSMRAPTRALYHRSMIAPPRDEAELLARALALHGMRVVATGVHGKGKVGELVERALATWDFPSLGVELKTIPLDEARAAPRESTFVCAVSLDDADRAEWATSWVRAKLQRVLWVPIEVREDGTRRIGRACLWSPTPEQDSVLGGDFEEILGRVGVGGIEGITAHLGRWLQLRPKAAHGRVRTVVRAAEGELVSTVPRGFYLRARFTGAILRDGTALP
jgi:DNA mismatch repair protein MutH